MTRSRALVYVESLLGIGHGKRIMALVRAMQQSGFDITCVSGSLRVDKSELAGAKLIKLPVVKVKDTQFTHLVDKNGLEVNDLWRKQRLEKLLKIYYELLPQVVLIEGFPFSRWQFRFELIPLIEAARGQSIIVGSVRDILVTKKNPYRIQQIVDLVQKNFDLVLIHGDKSLVEFSKTFPATKKIASKLRYTGYISSFSTESVTDTNLSKDEVLVSAGGGAVGFKLLSVALEARILGALSEKIWRFFGGHNLPESQMASLIKRAEAIEGVFVKRYSREFPLLLNSCALSISQAGYNTVVDILIARARSIIVPFSTASETEQTLRATLLRDRGLVTVLKDSALTPQSLKNTIRSMELSEKPPLARISVDGAMRSANLLYNLSTLKSIH